MLHDLREKENEDAPQLSYEGVWEWHTRKEGIARGDEVVFSDNAIVRRVRVAGEARTNHWGSPIFPCEVVEDSPEERNNRKHVHDGKMLDHFYTDYLVSVCPDIIWYHVEDVGSYSGSVYAVGWYKDKVLFLEDYYGSCSACGAWGDGGEPASQDDVLGKSTLCATEGEARVAVEKAAKENSDGPDVESCMIAVRQVLSDMKA